METCHSEAAKRGEESLQSREESEVIAQSSDGDEQGSRSGDALEDVDEACITRKIKEADTKR